MEKDEAEERSEVDEAEYVQEEKEVEEDAGCCSTIRVQQVIGGNLGLGRK